MENQIDMEKMCKEISLRLMSIKYEITMEVFVVGEYLIYLYPHLLYFHKGVDLLDMVKGYVKRNMHAFVGFISFNASAITDMDHWKLIKYFFRLKFKNTNVNSRQEYENSLPIDIDKLNCDGIQIKFMLLINYDELQKCSNNIHERFCTGYHNECANTFHSKLYINQCFNEIERMKHTMIKKNISLYDYIIRDSGKSMEKIILQPLIAKKVLSNYDIYHDIIEKYLSIAFHRYNLVNNLQIDWEEESNTSKTVSLDCDSVQMICQYLSNKDIESVTIAYN